MVAPPPVARGRIYISYRRQDTAFPASWLFDRLGDRFGGGQVFKDVDSIELGDDLVEVITRAVGSCDVLLALIGTEWLTVTDEDGRRRLDDPTDVVRLEIEAALSSGVRVIPILVDGARMPHADELPDNLAGLVRRQALELSPARFAFDIGRLLKVLDLTLAQVRATDEEAASVGAPAALPPATEERSDGATPASPVPERSAPAEPTEEPLWQPEEEVSFTAGYPGVVTPDVWYSLSVYVHLGRLQAEADQRIADESRWFGLRPAGSKAAAHVPLPKGTSLRVRPELRGVVFNPPAQEVRWLEDLQQVAFRLQATSEVVGRAVLGAVEVHAGPLLVAQVPLSIYVRGVGESQEPAEATAASTARLFSSVFASYAHEDDRVVRAFAEAYRALGIDVLVDKASLRSGQDWHQVLSRLIEEADLFQLFWSEAASRSRYVAEEWQQALSLQDRKGERFIRPLYWNTPWPPPPAQLAHLHFASLDLTQLSRVAGRRRPKARAFRRR
jgi:TIR domain